MLIEHLKFQEIQDILRNSDILIQLCDYRVCAVVSTKQWFSIGGGKHIVWISLY